MATHAQLNDPVRAAALKKRVRMTGIVLACVAFGIALSIWYSRVAAQ
jgi:flagellar biosynthesis/type III secretory pathway M-ring protein FliF/YscJ